MIIEQFSHNCALELIPASIKDGILNCLGNTNFIISEGCAEELRKVILKEIKDIGWSNDFKLDVNSQISLTSSFDNHVLCFQTGNMSRFYADILKLEYVFKKGKTSAGIYIIPSKEASLKMGSNIANFDRFTFELNLFKDIITIPILVLGIK